MHHPTSCQGASCLHLRRLEGLGIQPARWTNTREFLISGHGATHARTRHARKWTVSGVERQPGSSLKRSQERVRKLQHLRTSWRRTQDLKPSRDMASDLAAACRSQPSKAPRRSLRCKQEKPSEGAARVENPAGSIGTCRACLTGICFAQTQQKLRLPHATNQLPGARTNNLQTWCHRFTYDSLLLMTLHQLIVACSVLSFAWAGS